MALEKKISDSLNFKAIEPGQGGSVVDVKL